MNKSLLVALALGSILSACSSEPSDYRPGAKVSNDEVAPGTRSSDYSNFGGGAAGDVHHHDKGHEQMGTDQGAHGGREDVMLNHEEGTNKIGTETEQEDPARKTTDVDSVENHK
jgi:hypothetical protein